MPGSSPGMTKRSVPRFQFKNSAQHAKDVGLLHDEEILAVELHFGARPFAEQYAVADLDVDRDQLAGLVAYARTARDHQTIGGHLLGVVENNDSAQSLLFD